LKKTETGRGGETSTSNNEESGGGGKTKTEKSQAHLERAPWTESTQKSQIKRGGSREEKEKVCTPVDDFLSRRIGAKKGIGNPKKATGSEKCRSRGALPELMPVDQQIIGDPIARGRENCDSGGQTWPKHTKPKKSNIPIKPSWPRRTNKASEAGDTKPPTAYLFYARVAETCPENWKTMDARIEGEQRNTPSGSKVGHLSRSVRTLGGYKSSLSTKYGKNGRVKTKL